MKDPAFLFYPNDWLGGTMGMTFEQKGAYMELLMLQFNRGHMTSHMIGQILGQSFGQNWDAIKSKFEEDENGHFFNRRLEEEQIKRKAFTDSRKNNRSGKNQHSKTITNEGSSVGHMSSLMENENENRNEVIVSNNDQVLLAEIISVLEFEEFWTLYDKKVGDKTKLKTKWKTINEDERRKILEHVPLYKESQPDKQFRKDPQTYLNNKSWNDEIIFKNGINSKGDKPTRDYEKLARVIQKHTSQ